MAGGAAAARPCYPRPRGRLDGPARREATVMSSARLALASLALLAGCRAQPAPADRASAPAPEPPAAPVAAPAGPQPSDAMRALVTEVFGPVLKPAAGETTFPLVVVGILQGGEQQVLEFGAIERAQPA